MSYTTLFKVPESGPIEAVAEYQNSHGAGAYVWSALCARYLGNEYAWLIGSEMDRRRLWDIPNRSGVPDYERITLGTTTDSVMVKRENIPLVAASFRAFVEAHPPGNRVCSLLEQARDLDKLAEDESCFAVCWNQTSVYDAWLEPNDDDESDRWYDISRDSQHYFLFDELPLNDDADQEDDLVRRCRENPEWAAARIRELEGNASGRPTT